MKKRLYRLKPPPGYLNTRQAAIRLGVTNRTVRRYIENGALPAFRARKDHPGSPFRIRLEDLKKFKKPLPSGKPIRQPRIESSEKENGCFFCTSHKPNKTGYSMMRYRGRRIRVVQYIYERKHGPLLPGFSVETSCGYKRCIKHLILVPPSTNNKKYRNNKRTVLTERIVILGRLDKESTHREFALKHGLQDHTGAIASARTGKSWKYLNDKVAPLKSNFTPRGEKHYAAKPSIHDVQEILAAKGIVSASTLAKKYGVTPQTIYNIWSGKTWKNIPTRNEHKMGRGA